MARLVSPGSGQMRSTHGDYYQTHLAALAPERSIAPTTKGDSEKTKRPKNRVSRTIHAEMLMRYTAVTEQSTVVYDTVIEMIKGKVKRIAHRVRVWWDKKR